MGRINISITEKKTDKWVINELFCRSSDLEFFCKDSKEVILEDFYYDIVMGIDLGKHNMHNYLEKIDYVINFLNNIPSDKRPSYFPFYKEDFYLDFIKDLKNSRDYINDFIDKNDIEDYLIEIIQ